MKQGLRFAIIACAAAFVVACNDAPTEITDDHAGTPAFAMGGNKPDKGGGGDVSADMIRLGEFLSQDENLSLNHDQSCQSCHHPDMGFAAPLPGTTAQGRT
jgi:cytochrome c peroxidase